MGRTKADASDSLRHTPEEAKRFATLHLRMLKRMERYDRDIRKASETAHTHGGFREWNERMLANIQARIRRSPRHLT